MDNLAGGQPFVEVAAAAEDQDPPSFVAKRPGMGPVPTGRVGREEGQRVERDAFLARTQDFGCPGEAAAQEHEHVVVVGPEAAGQFPGTVRRPLDGVLHVAMVEGGPPAGA